jgi:HEAT repeat protein
MVNQVKARSELPFRPLTPPSLILPETRTDAERALETLHAVIREIEEFLRAERPEDRLRRLRYISQFTHYLSDEALRALATENLRDDDHRIRGETCYLLGRSERPCLIPLLEPLLKDPHPWVQEQAREALQILEQAALAQSGYLELRRQIDRIEKGDFDDEILQALVGPALHNPDPKVRGEACYLIEKWSEVSKQKAAQFEPQLRRMSRHDSAPWVREQAAGAAEKLAIISDNAIDLDLFSVAGVYRKMEILQEVSQRISDFDGETLQALIGYALHDPDPAIRGTASQLLQEWAAIGVWKCTRLELQVREMAFHDPNPWVRKQAVAVAQKLYWPALIQRWGGFVLLYVILVVILSLVALPILGNISSASVLFLSSSCENPYAQSIVQAFGTDNESQATGAPDAVYASVGLEADSVLILDMGQDNLIIAGPGTDLYYYERPNGPGIYLDAVQVSVAQDNGSGDPDSFTTVFVWGDDDPTNNGTIPPEYLENGEETPNEPIESEDLYNGHGIGINIGGSDGTSYCQSAAVVVHP